MQIICDLILLAWNNLTITRQCVDSILRLTSTPSRLIIVDNGSTEKGMKEYLSAITGNNAIDVRLITNLVNEGFAKGMNMGIKASDSPYVCLLNNDVLVTDGWLEEMIKVAVQNPKIGMVNPSSNNFGLRFGKDTTLEEFARTFRNQTGKWIEMGSCVGFCMLIKREVIEKIGYLNESYGLAYFEDTDYSRRAQAAGYKCAMAKGCYVFHAEGQSTKFLDDRDRLFRKGAEIFYSKWGKPERIAYILSKNNQGCFEKAKQAIWEQANSNSRIWIFQDESSGIFEPPEHLNVMLNQLSHRFFRFKAFWNIIKKKKKFDRLFVDDPKIAKVLNSLKQIHKAEISLIS